ncbi:hypothetical protein B0H66DRAFT_548635 [Apodospora peruviana]|uniref:Secreted protein n=1 Tax=Apodospora peruviana TaxID=516989 RepID=A0AAE0IID9_9PEZI|nr:hypothetical protein B0H66DRAFT_548635 [Apodospora peruviana]
MAFPSLLFTTCLCAFTRGWGVRYGIEAGAGGWRPVDTGEALHYERIARAFERADLGSRFWQCSLVSAFIPFPLPV